MNETGLEPCPVCGGAPKWRGSATDYRMGIFRLQCIGETHLFQSYGATEAICIAAWNTRIATPPAEPAENAELIELLDEAEGAAQWLDQMADRFESEWPNTAKHCRIHVNSLRAAIAALQSTGRVERLEEALHECSDKLWVLRCNSRDPLDREAAEKACDLARQALSGER